MDRDLAVVIPTYFAETTQPALRRRLHADALGGLELFVAAERCFLVVDGAPWLAEDVGSAADEFGRRAGSASPVVHTLPRHLGKAGAMVAGLRLALEPGASRIAVLDCDGDHSPYDLPGLVGLLGMVKDHTGRAAVEIVGRRASRHGSLGFVRGELEGLSSRVVFAALRLALARDRQEALDETWVAPYGEPDLEAGYRVYSRRAAEIVVESVPRAVAESGDRNLLRYGVEVVPTVEIVLAGGVHAEGLRSTLESQPVSSYMADQSPADVFASELRWVFRRCGVRAEAALLMLEDAALRTVLRTDAAGRECLDALIAGAVGALDGGETVLARRSERPRRRL